MNHPTEITPAPARQSSGLAKASLIIGCVGTVAYLLVLVLTLGAAATHSQAPVLLLIIGFSVIGGVALNLVGLVLGLVALIQSSGHSTMAIVAIVINGVELATLLLLLVIGLVMKRSHATQPEAEESGSRIRLHAEWARPGVAGKRS